MAQKLMAAAGGVVALLAVTATPAFAANSFDQTMDTITSWMQARVLPVAILAVVIGGFLLMVKQELGRRVLAGVLFGTVLIFFAKPLVTGMLSLASSVAH